MVGAGVGSDFVNSVTVTDPPEVASPEVVVGESKAPTAGGNFANEGMVVGFVVCAASRGGEDGLEADGLKCDVESDGGRVTGAEKGDGGSCGVGVLWLHEDERHAGLGPIGLEESRERAVVSAEERI